MKVDFADDPQFFAAIQAGIIAALKSPEFIRALAAEEWVRRRSCSPRSRCAD